MSKGNPTDLEFLLSLHCQGNKHWQPHRDLGDGHKSHERFSTVYQPGQRRKYQGEVVGEHNLDEAAVLGRAE